MTVVSAKKLILVSTACAIGVIAPVCRDGLPDGVAGWVPQAPVVFAADPFAADPKFDRENPGVMLNQTREYLEQQRVMQQMDEDEARRKAQVEATPQSQEESTAQVTFALKAVRVDTSEVLAEAEVNAITAPYLGKTVSLQDLYAITGAINKLYADKGYMICRAYLPPQRIHEGVVQIHLVEGKTGLVTVTGLSHTRKGYVTHRIPLKPDKVANTAELNKQLLRFNGTNDVQLRIAVHAGEKPGTTDYEIMAYEPKDNNSVTVYLDNSGYESSGRFRQGVFYTMRSLTGQRDSLRLNYLRSRGTNMFGSGYSLPLNNRGTRLDIDYSTNTTEIKKGDLTDVGVKGHAYAASLTLRHPLRVDQKRRYEVGLQYLHQKSMTDLGTNTDSRINWVDDVRNTYIPYISFIHYGGSSIFYHRHSFPYTNWNGAYENQNDYLNYQVEAMYQKKYKHGQMFFGRLSGQLSSDKDRSSADRFYVGGSNSVRGYEESYVGGNKGMSAGFTYQTPLNRKQTLNAFAFFDYGLLKSIYNDGGTYSLYSTGLGVSAGYKNLYASMTLGFPLKRSYDFTTEKANRTRVDFICSYTF